MVKLMGHLAFGLLAAASAWFVWDGRTSLAFVGFVLVTVMLPDADLVLRQVFPTVHHHGVTHTILFVTVVAVLAGVVATAVFTPLLERWRLKSDGHTVSRGAIYLFVTGGLLLGGLTHIFADMLSSPDVAQPVEPLWPFLNKPISLDVIYFSSVWWNVGLLALAVVLHLVLFSIDVFPIEHRYRIGNA